MAKYIKAKYKYQLLDTYILAVPIEETKWGPYTAIHNGHLWISDGYAWDGPSGPVADTPKTMRASLVHDALYQLIREKALSPGHRKLADQIFRDLCIEDGVPKWLARIYYKGLRAFGKPAATKPKRIYEI